MKLNFKSFGQGDPLVILHGMFGMLDNWQMIAKELAKNYMLFIVDLRNHGRSPHADEFGYATMANDVYEFMNDNWMYEASLIGHSMGGKVAMHFAQDHEDMVENLIVVDMAPKAYAGNHDTIIDALQKLPIKKIESRSEAADFLQQYIAEKDVIQFLLKNLSRDKDTGGYRWKMNLDVIANHYEEILDYDPRNKMYEGPTLFMKGEKSDYIQPNELDDYKKYFPNAELATIRDAGHWIHAEQPQAFLETLTSFLQKA